MTDEKKLEAIHNLLGKHNIVFSVNFIDELKSIIEQFEPILYKCKHLGCEIMRTKEEGGTTFTVCDYHWENRNAPPGNPAQNDAMNNNIIEGKGKDMSGISNDRKSTKFKIGERVIGEVEVIS